MGQSSSSDRVAITGATGFLGRRLTAALAGQGTQVIALGRNLEKGMSLERPGVVFRPVELEDKQGLIAVLSGIRVVIHAAALSSAWGSKRDFQRINVDGTRNVIQAAQIAGVQRLIYLSSPSVLSTAIDQRGLVENGQPPDQYVSEYSRSKMAAERLVLQAYLETVIIRPKAIYGPGDTTLLPRLVKAARTGRLKQIGDGHTTTNLTHVDDVVQGIILALNSTTAVGKTYTLTGGEDIKLWDLISELTDRLSLPGPSKVVPVRRANFVAGLLEFAWRHLHLPGEPPLTRYAVEILGYDKTYDISAARRDLGYAPRISIAQGLDELVHEELVKKPRPVSRSHFKVPPSSKVTEVDFSLLNSGTVTTRRKYFEVNGNFEQIRVPNLFAVMNHPREGIVLFDTGYTPRFHKGTRHMPFCLYAMITPVSIEPGQTAVNQLKEKKISPESVRWIILSHFHPDHYGGLKDFPNATIVCRADGWAHARGRRGFAALRAGMIPGHLPGDFSARLRLLPSFEGKPMAPFSHSFDLFNDGSIRLIDLPGHMPGHIGAWVRADDNRIYALVADAVWTQDSIDYPQKGLHRLIADDRPKRDATVRMLQELKRSQPDVAIIPSHCPVAARAFNTGFP